MKTFGGSVNQSSTDPNRYISMAPANMVYDKRARTYVRGSNFNPLFLEPDAGFYISQLHLVAEGVLDLTDVWIGQFQSYDAEPLPARGMSAKTLRSMIASIRRSEQIEVRYQSLSWPEPRWRWIAPHAIGFDGFRWHLWAFCLSDQRFKNFLLSRIIETRDNSPSGVDPASDVEWYDQIQFEIGPHPDLSEAQLKVVAWGYGMHDGRATILVREALLYYTLKHLGLDTDPAAGRPWDQQIVLLNRDAVYPYIGNMAP